MVNQYWNKRRWYPQPQGGLTIPFYTNAVTLRAALPATLCLPQDGKNLVPRVFCNPRSRNLRNPIKTRNLRNRRNPQPPKPSKPRQLSKGKQFLEPGTFPRPRPSKTGTHRPWNRFPEIGLLAKYLPRSSNQPLFCSTLV